MGGGVYDGDGWWDGGVLRACQFAEREKDTFERERKREHAQLAGSAVRLNTEGRREKLTPTAPIAANASAETLLNLN